MDRLMVKDLKINEAVVIPLIITAATPRKTKAGKDYLQMEFTDGSLPISGNYWDWLGKEIPTTNSIVYNVKATVNVWQNAKQLNVSGITTNAELTTDCFIPDSGINIEGLLEEAFTLANGCKTELLRVIALQALIKYGNKWKTSPAARGVHHAFKGGTLVHSISVAKKAAAIAQLTPGANADLCLIGGLLHDIGKLYGYGFDHAVPIMTEIGRTCEHSFLGANMIDYICEEVGVDEEDALLATLLRHIILSHHGQLEFGAVVQPLCMEALIVNKADEIDATCQTVYEACENLDETVQWTGKIWTQNNRELFNYKYVKDQTKDVSDLPF